MAWPQTLYLAGALFATATWPGHLTVGAIMMVLGVLIPTPRCCHCDRRH